MEGSGFMHSALFLDLGDTLVRVEDDEIYTDADGRIEFLPGVVDVLNEKIGDWDLAFIVTNQSGIERGIVDFATSISFVDQVNNAVGGRITDFWACPFKASDYRKPNPGMILGLADKHFVDLKQSILVGDSESDRQCALAAGVSAFVWAHEFFGS